MKIIAFILLLIFTTFIAIPCTDTHSNEQNDHKEYGSIECTNAHSDVMPHYESCTPLCICGCCSTQLVEMNNQAVLLLKYTLVDSEEPIFATLDQFVSPRITPPKS